MKHKTATQTRTKILGVMGGDSLNLRDELRRLTNECTGPLSQCPRGDKRANDARRRTSDRHATAGLLWQSAAQAASNTGSSYGERASCVEGGRLADRRRRTDRNYREPTPGSGRRVKGRYLPARVPVQDSARSGNH